MKTNQSHDKECFPSSQAHTFLAHLLVNMMIQTSGNNMKHLNTTKPDWFPWVYSVEDISFVDVAAICVQFGMFIGVKQFITKYLESRAEDRRTLQDHAHKFFFESVRDMAASYYIFRMIKETLGFHRGEEMVAAVVSATCQTSVGVVCVALLCDLITQYILVIKSHLLVRLRVPEETLVRRVRIGSWMLLGIINALFTAAGDRSMIYYIWRDQPFQHVDGMFIFGNILTGCCFSCSAILRVKVCKHIRMEGQQSTQILSSKVMVFMLILLALFLPIVVFSSQIFTAGLYQYFLDFSLFLATTFFLLLIILFHPGLRSHAIKRITETPQNVNNALAKFYRWVFNQGDPPIHSLNAM